MAAIRLQKIIKKFPFRHSDVYFIAGANLALVLGIIFRGNEFTHSMFFPLFLIASVTMLLNIIITRPKSQAKLIRKNFIIIIALQTLLLLIVPANIPMLPVYNITLYKIIFVILIQSSAMVFLWKVFRKEMSELFFIYVPKMHNLRTVSFKNS